ncbi:MAG: hypothetical protein ACFCVK_24125 [Acidimicrobiales bacterium]
MRRGRGDGLAAGVGLGLDPAAGQRERDRPRVVRRLGHGPDPGGDQRQSGDTEVGEPLLRFPHLR